MYKESRYDFVLLMPVAILVTIGIIMVLSTSHVVGFTNFGDGYFFIKKHLFYVVLSIIALAIGAVVPYSLYRKYALWGIGLSVVLLLLTFAPGIGQKIGGANRWLNFRVFHLQPVEVAKFFIVVFLASSLDFKQKKVAKFGQTGLPILLVCMLPVAILLQQPDLGNVGLILMVIFCMVFLGGFRVSHLVTISLAGMGVIAGAIATHPYQMVRIQAFLSPMSDPTGKNYHMVQSLIAIGSGGILGEGLGQGKLKYSYLPLQYSDFIYSIICEEGGFILGAIILGLFGFLFCRGFQIARLAGSVYGYLLAIGVTLMIVFQALLNIGVVIGVLPVTGIPLTFISFGGTSLITSMFYVGVLLSISRSGTKSIG
ncbi:MAG: cell division protein FtsW [Candidatus Marinamargulisbacteria bacterium]|jgi:cell division protein FtsW